MKSFLSSSKIFFLAGVLALGGAACGGDDDGATTTPDGAPGAADAAPGADAADPEGWSELVGGDWHLDAQTEGYWCATKVISEKTYVGAFRPIAPVGTHHTVVSYGPAQAGAVDDPGSPCSAGTEKPNWIYASGVGTGELILPEGVGMVLDAGYVVHVNLHLFNTSDNAISGHSGVEVKKVTEADVVHEADILLAGPAQFTIPAGETKTVSGNCTVASAETIFALFPHMHQIGRHIKTEVVRADGERQVLSDADYNFENQPFFNFDPLPLVPGDKIATTCTYQNPHAAGTPPVEFGQSSTDEMCFSIVMRYPRQPVGPFGAICWDGPTAP
jgi:hypothetical protein